MLDKGLIITFFVILVLTIGVAYSSSYTITGITTTSTCGADGGTESDDGTYCYHVFTANGTFVLDTTRTLSYMIVGGGGAGGSGQNGAGGGGGAGGVVINWSNTIGANSYGVVIGNGGQASEQDGGLSSFLGHIAYGGGGGAGNSYVGKNGGSGGGSGRDGGYNWANATQPTSATGGLGSRSSQAGGGAWRSGSGGGGAGGIGQAGGNDQASRNLSTVESNGGAGILTNISGSEQWYAGGGAGAWQTGSAENRATGTAGAGNGSINSGSTKATSARANTGSGGGGNQAGSTGDAGKGGTGIVIIRYLKSSVSDANIMLFNSVNNTYDNNNVYLNSSVVAYTNSTLTNANITIYYNTTYVASWLQTLSANVLYIFNSTVKTISRSNATSLISVNTNISVAGMSALDTVYTINPSNSTGTTASCNLGCLTISSNCYASIVSGCTVIGVI